MIEVALETEQPNKNSVAVSMLPPEPGTALPISEMLLEQALQALAIAIFENEGGLIPTKS
jgi:hypothetical protein